MDLSTPKKLEVACRAFLNSAIGGTDQYQKEPRETSAWCETCTWETFGQALGKWLCWCSHWEGTVYVAWTTDCLPLHYCTQRLENPKLTSHGHQDSWRGANSKHSTFRELSSGIFIRNCHWRHQDIAFKTPQTPFTLSYYAAHDGGRRTGRFKTMRYKTQGVGMDQNLTGFRGDEHLQVFVP